MWRCCRSRKSVICLTFIRTAFYLFPSFRGSLCPSISYAQKKAAVQQLYLGRSPPIFTEIRVLHEPDGDDDMVTLMWTSYISRLRLCLLILISKVLILQILELGMNFLSAEDMVAVLAVQLRKRLGFGMRAKMHVTGMHVEGKVRSWLNSLLSCEG